MALNVRPQVNGARVGGSSPAVELDVSTDRHLVGGRHKSTETRTRGRSTPTWQAALTRLLVALLLTCNAPMAHAEDVFVKDGANSCAVFKPNLKAGENVSWQGACLSGHGSGPGVAKWGAPDGSSVTFEGNFTAGKLQGEGRMSASGGDRYVGAYKDGRREGYGTYVASNQDRYEGQYKNNQRHGHGMLTLASGHRVEGEWANGVQVASKALAPAGLEPAAPTVVGAAGPAAQAAPQKRIDAAAQPQTPIQAGTESPPSLSAATPALSPRQQAQQQQLALRQQQQLERQKAQEEQAKQQLAQQELQRQHLADQRRAYERQKTIDAILFLLLLTSPLLLAALVWQLQWRPAVTAADSVGSWIARRAEKVSERAGYFAAFVERPTLWCARKMFEFTSTMGDQFLKAGVQLALCLYLIGFVLFLAYVITVIVITIAIIVFGFVVLGEVLRSQGDNSQRRSESSYTPRPSYAYSDGESRHREGLLGDYTETRDASGNVVAESREREGLLGRYTETRDANGNVVAESRERDGLLGPYTETRDADGKVIAESRRREGLLGPYTETRDADGKVVSESRDRDGLLGHYTEHKRV